MKQAVPYDKERGTSLNAAIYALGVVGEIHEVRDEITVGGKNLEKEAGDVATYLLLYANVREASLGFPMEWSFSDLCEKRYSRNIHSSAHFLWNELAFHGCKLAENEKKILSGGGKPELIGQLCTAVLAALVDFCAIVNVDLDKAFQRVTKMNQEKFGAASSR